MNKDNDYTPFIIEGTVNSDVVIACFNSFSNRIHKETFVIMDNSPVHKSGKFLDCLPEWEKKGLYIKFIPTYSPELNLTEILWRKVKYEWLPFSAWNSLESLFEALSDILLNLGSMYIIDLK